jgi:hypothetical protein
MDTLAKSEMAFAVVTFYIEPIAIWVVRIITIAPAGMSTPPILVSSMTIRHICADGIVRRSNSSTILGMSSGFCCTFFN